MLMVKKTKLKSNVEWWIWKKKSVKKINPKKKDQCQPR